MIYGTFARRAVDDNRMLMPSRTAIEARQESSRRQRLLDRLSQFIHAEGLANHAGGVRAQQLDGRLRLWPTRAQQHRYVGTALAQSLESRGGVLTRHHQIEDNQIARLSAAKVLQSIGRTSPQARDRGTFSLLPFVFRRFQVRDHGRLVLLREKNDHASLDSLTAIIGNEVAIKLPFDAALLRPTQLPVSVFRDLPRVFER
jgi:hypothetical protein